MVPAFFPARESYQRIGVRESMAADNQNTRNLGRKSLSSYPLPPLNTLQIISTDLDESQE